jgi:gliding motility-associated-like protein
MKYRAVILFFAYVINSPVGVAQDINNLIANGRFQVNSCFYPIDNIWKVNGWDACVPNENSSSDFFDLCQFPRFPATMSLLNPKIFINQYDGVAGIQLITAQSFYREYIQSYTKELLTKDTIYIVELTIRPLYYLAQIGLFVNRVELFFSNSKLSANLEQGFIPGRIDTTPTLFYQGAFLNDTSNWTTLKFTYKAKGGEQWLVVGNFSPDSLIGTQRANDGYQGTYKSAYYLIDDVMVYKASDTLKQLPEPILPNVFSPNGDGVNEVYALENLPENSTLEVFNRWGGLVFTQAPYQNNWPGNAPNGQPVADGVYFFLLTYQDQNGQLQQKRQTVHVVR